MSAASNGSWERRPRRERPPGAPSARFAAGARLPQGRLGQKQIYHGGSGARAAKGHGCAIVDPFAAGARLPRVCRASPWPDARVRAAGVGAAPRREEPPLRATQ